MGSPPSSDLQVVSQLLSTRVERYVRNDSRVLIDALLEVASDARLARTIAALSRDAALLEYVRSNSYLHSNGFLKLTLASAREYQLRLHIWDTRPDGLPYSEEDVHNHSADFASIILAGSYRHELFAPADAGESFRKFRYVGERGARTFSLSQTGAARLQKFSDSSLAMGTYYSLSASTLHRVVPAEDMLTVSLVLKGPVNNDQIEVFSSSEIPVGSAVPVSDLPLGSVEKYVTELVETGTF